MADDALLLAQGGSNLLGNNASSLLLTNNNNNLATASPTGNSTIAAAGRTTLILGDENFTFVLPFLESRHHAPDETVEVGVCLPEEKLPDDFRPNYLGVNSAGVRIHFGINPAQLRNHFFSGEFDRIIFVLPGIATKGFPEFLDKKSDLLFRLRLHMYFFGFLKSSRSALKPETGIVQLLWPTQSVDGQLGPEVPWHGVEINKIGSFCDIHRRSDFDELLDYDAFSEWRPLIHGVVSADCCPPYLANCTFYTWSLTPSPVPPTMLPEAAEHAHKDQNLLFVPPQLWSHSSETISHVNDLFNFQLPTNVPDELLVVSRPTLKFDPRFRGDNNPTVRPAPRRPPTATATTGGPAGTQQQQQPQQQQQQMPLSNMRQPRGGRPPMRPPPPPPPPPPMMMIPPPPPTAAGGFIDHFFQQRQPYTQPYMENYNMIETPDLTACREMELGLGPPPPETIVPKTLYESPLYQQQSEKADRNNRSRSRTRNNNNANNTNNNRPSSRSPKRRRRSPDNDSRRFRRRV